MHVTWSVILEEAVFGEPSYVTSEIIFFFLEMKHHLKGMGPLKKRNTSSIPKLESSLVRIFI